MSVTPSLLQRGRQTKGSIPLPPLLSEIIFNLPGGYRNRGDDESGGGGSTTCWSPQERLIVSMRISTKPHFFKKYHFLKKRRVQEKK
jgi:hypothetical protein